MCYFCCCCCCCCCTIYYYVTAAAIITFFLSSAPFNNAQPPPPTSALPSPPPLLPSPSPSPTLVKKNASATVVVGSPSPPLSSPSPPLPPSPSPAIFVTPAPSSPTDSSHRKPRQLIRIILGSNLKAFFGVFFMVSFCFYVFKNKGESKELDEFYVDQVPGMPIRFSYKDLRTMTCNFNDKLREGGFGSIFQKKLSDSTKIAVKHLNGFDHVKKSFLVKFTSICPMDPWILGSSTTTKTSLLGGNPGRRSSWFLDIAKELTYLHEECRQKIFHLDIKPQNILLDEDFNAKISDFGLSKLIDQDQSQVLTMIRGTPGYLAPKRLSSIITEKVDVYSFGVVVLEMLCGHKNLDRSQPEEDMHLLGLFKSKAEEKRLLYRAEVVEMMRVTVWCLQSDFSRRPSLSVVVKVLKGSVDVQSNLGYSFTPSVALRAITVASNQKDRIGAATLFASALSGPRK
ncbi:unnamed protein product [Camellia sinensis]